MVRVIGAAILIGLAGCASLGFEHLQPPDKLPPESSAGGTAVALEDVRPDWEKESYDIDTDPKVGWKLGSLRIWPARRVSPDAWEWVAAEARAAAAEMPQQPARVDVQVRAYRLVRVAPKVPRTALDSLPQPVIPGVLTTPFPGVHPAGLKDHPEGVSCALVAEVRLRFADGRERSLQVNVMGRTTLVPETPYAGEPDRAAVRDAVRLFGRQLREEAGQPGN
ncbi:MAG TPA: hypothetical protein VH092_32865 [Urbifossiella sp.]|jgi:hypothetical protein|nr:hypothetical protein [Urbifossiella sp.]